MGIELVRWRYSTTEGLAGNTQAQPSPDASLGLYVSTTDWTSGSLFDTQLTADQAVGPDYRCVFAVNLNGTLTLDEASVYLTGTLPVLSTIAIGLDPAGIKAVDSAEAQAGQVLSENVSPSGVSFSGPTSLEASIPMGILEPMTAQAVWVRRTPGATGLATSESFTLRLSGTLAPHAP